MTPAETSRKLASILMVEIPKTHELTRNRYILSKVIP